MLPSAFVPSIADEAPTYTFAFSTLRSFLHLRFLFPSPHLGSYRNQHYSPQPPSEHPPAHTRTPAGTHQDRNQHHSPPPSPQQQPTRKEDLNKAERARLVLSPSPSLPGRRWGPSTRGPTIDTWSGVGGDAGPRADHQCGAAHLCAGANPGVSLASRLTAAAPRV